MRFLIARVVANGVPAGVQDEIPGIISQASPDAVSIPAAFLLGIIQGLTEFLPVSSTAHLRIVSAFLDMPDPGAAYSAVIQLGTLIALLIFFRQDLVEFSRASLGGLLGGEPFRDLNARMAYFLILGTVPVSVFGLLLSDYIKGPFRSLYVIAGSLIVLGLLLYVADRRLAKLAAASQAADGSSSLRGIENVHWWDALLIGLAQSLALVPGSSRSGTTLTMGLFLGFSRYAAMRFSFLLSIPAIGLSGVYELIKDYHELEQAGLAGLIVGTLTSAVVGYAAVAGLLRYLRTHSTLPFVLYRIGMGLLILGLLYAGWIEP